MQDTEEHIIADHEDHRREFPSTYRRVLMISFHFPPVASSAGALRSRAFADYLPRYGWQAHVLAPVERAYEATDNTFNVPDGVNVHRAWAADTRRAFGWRGRYPAIMATPDRWISWMPAGVAEGLRVVRDFSIDAIWSTYPIATSHLIAGVIARRTGLPWVAEFRDPVQPTSGLINRAAQNSIERYVANHCDRLVFVTNGALRAAQSRFPHVANRMHMIPNGYDHAFESPSSPEIMPRPKSRPIVLVHSGHFYPDGRSPLALLKALAKLKETREIDARSLQIVLRNTQQDRWLAPEIESLNIGDIVVLAPRLSHRSALAEQKSAHGLILIQGRKFNNQVPAKLFEYMRSGRPTLALVHPEGDTASLLTELKAGTTADPDLVNEITDALREFIRRLMTEIESERLSTPDPRLLCDFSRQKQTKKLAELLNSI